MSMQAFKDALNKKLAEAGYTEAEIRLATIAAEARTVMGMLGHVAAGLGTDALDLPAAALAGTHAKLLAYSLRAAGLDHTRVVKAADLIFTDCMEKATEITVKEQAKPTAEIPAWLQAAMNSRPARPEDVN